MVDEQAAADVDVLLVLAETDGVDILVGFTQVW